MESVNVKRANAKTEGQTPGFQWMQDWVAELRIYCQSETRSGEAKLYTSRRVQCNGIKQSWGGFLGH